MRKKILVLMPMMLLCALLIRAQNHEVTGKVVDSTGAGVPGASINVKGERKGTSADASGFFRIPVKENGIITVSGIGFTSQEINVRSQSSVVVTLTSSDKTLNEVVVTALGIRREKRELTTASQTVDGALLNKSGTGNPLGELEGKASGLTVINSTGDPGGGTYIRLRGATSITGNNQPLMVVDGVPIDNSINNYDPTNAGFQAGGASGSLTGGVQPTNRGTDINPNDIESISILKGPAATALYGIQASSGAIIITTKKGGAGKRTTITLNSAVTMDKVSQLPGLQSQFSQGSGGKYSPPEAGGSISWGAAIDTLSWDGATDYGFDKHGNIVGRSDPSAKTPVTPYDRYGSFFKTGLTLNNNIALSGGSEKSGYRLSLGNVSQTGIVPKTKFEKTTMSLSGQSRISDKLTTSAGITYTNSSNYKVQQGSNISGIMLGLARTPVTFDNSNGYGSDAYRHKDAYQFPDGSQRNYRGGAGYDNPFWIVNNIPTTSDVDRVFGYGQVDYAPLSWMSFTYRVGGDVYAQVDKTSYDINSNAAPAGALYNIGYNNRQFNSDFIVNLHKNFSENFGGSVILGHNYFTLSQNNVFTNGNGFNVQGFYDLSNAQSILASETQQRKRTQAFYGEAELNYKKMLYLTLTGRQETSSTLPSANNTFFYPSVGLGWVFTELPGFKNSNTLSFGKLRASFAQVGKDAPIYGLTTPFSSASIKDGFTSGITFPANGSSGYQVSSGITVIGNPLLKPENTFSYELGTDLGFFNNRISLNATAYYSKSTDVIFQVSLPYTTGFAGELLNAATLTNKGLELTLNTTPIKTSYGLKWDLTFNWSRNLNKVTKLYPGIDNFFMGGFGGGEAGIFAIPGQPYGVIYGSTTPHSDLNNLNSPLLISDNPDDGDAYGQPIGGGVGPNLVIGNPNPDWFGAVISSLTFKGLSLGIQVDVRHGGDMWNGTRGALINKGTSYKTANRGQATVFQGLLGHINAAGEVVHFEGTLEKPGPGAANTIQSSYNQGYWQNTGNSFGGGQETDIEDASFTRIRQISLTYEIVGSLLRKAHFTSLSLTAFANNVHLWTKYDGVDPETSLSGPSNVQGLDYFNNPSTKSYGLRLNVGF